MTHFKSTLKIADKNNQAALLLCLIPVLIYWIIFFRFALNANYIAYDDTLILSIIPAFEEASWMERWKLLSGLFPEHRLVFSRSVVLLTNLLFGKVDLTYLMIIANICYTACIWVFYKVFRSLNLSLWYFIPIVWLWFSIQAFENMFWGVSSLCNFGVLLFVLLAVYYASFEENKPWKAILFALLATFTYGNGLFSFPLLIILFWISGNRFSAAFSIVTAIAVVIIYFSDFKPITQNLDFKDPEQARQGFWGLFGFIGSVWTLAAYEGKITIKYIASAGGILMCITILVIFKNYLSSLWKGLLGKAAEIPAPLRFVLGLALFILITAMATTYKRIPTDTFEGMFKGRYRMYSMMSLLAIYLGAIQTIRFPAKAIFLTIALPFAIGLNSIIVFYNIADIINNRRMAVVQEFNSRYNADWLGLAMFDMDQAHFEAIRAYYQSEDPLAKGWDPRIQNASLPCEGQYPINAPFTTADGNLYIRSDNESAQPVHNYSEGSYILMKSAEHTYLSSPHQSRTSVRKFLSTFNYLQPVITGVFHQATIQPGTYQIYVLEHRDGQNKLYCTGKIWVEND